MSAIIGPITPGKIAFALGSIGVGALVGGLWADSKDGDVAKGAVYGGLAAAAGLALITGGAYAWNRFQAGRSAAVAGASQLGSTLSHSLTPVTTTATTTATHAATSNAATVSTLMRLPTPASLFHTPSVLTPALTTTVPAIARTPMLPVASSSGGTFVDALRAFIR